MSQWNERGTFKSFEKAQQLVSLPCPASAMGLRDMLLGGGALINRGSSGRRGEKTLKAVADSFEDVAVLQGQAPCVATKDIVRHEECSNSGNLRADKNSVALKYR